MCYQRLQAARLSNYRTLWMVLSVCFMSHTFTEVNDFGVHLAVYNHIERGGRGAYLTPSAVFRVTELCVRIIDFVVQQRKTQGKASPHHIPS